MSLEDFTCDDCGESSKELITDPETGNTLCQSCLFKRHDDEAPALEEGEHRQIFDVGGECFGRLEQTHWFTVGLTF